MESGTLVVKIENYKIDKLARFKNPVKQCWGVLVGCQGIAVEDARAL